jgi:hypothetical protein
MRCRKQLETFSETLRVFNPAQKEKKRKKKRGRSSFS